MEKSSAQIVFEHAAEGRRGAGFNCSIRCGAVSFFSLAEYTRFVVYLCQHDFNVLDLPEPYVSSTGFFVLKVV